MKKNEKNGTLSDIDMDWSDTSYIQISGGYKNRNLETPFLSVFFKKIWGRTIISKMDIYSF